MRYTVDRKATAGTMVTIGSVCIRIIARIPRAYHLNRLPSHIRTELSSKILENSQSGSAWVISTIR